MPAFRYAALLDIFMRVADRALFHHSYGVLSACCCASSAERSTYSAAAAYLRAAATLIDYFHAYCFIFYAANAFGYRRLLPPFRVMRYAMRDYMPALRQAPHAPRRCYFITTHHIDAPMTILLPRVTLILRPRRRCLTSASCAPY